MKKIVVATDFSSCAENAMRYAIAIAKQQTASITVLHFAHPTQTMDNNVWNSYFMEDLIEAKREALKEWVAKFMGEAVAIEAFCQINFLVNGLVEYIEENPCNLLVMGSTGSSGLSGILGSNAASVVSNILLPTLIIPSDAVFKRNAKIALASDFKPIEKENAQNLKNMARATASDSIQILHVCVADDNALKTKQEEAISSELPDIKLQFHYLKCDNIETAIDEYIIENDIDLLCSITHQHSFLYRLFRRNKVKVLVNHLVKPIFVLHDK